MPLMDFSTPGQADEIKEQEPKVAQLLLKLSRLVPPAIWYRTLCNAQGLQEAQGWCSLRRRKQLSS
jgi:hypothetical protein